MKPAIPLWWGAPGQLYGGTGPLIDGVWTPGERFQDLNGDGEWNGPTNMVGGEPFEDFISWWIPFAGIDGQGRWLGGVLGGCVLPENMPNLSPTYDNAIPCDDYVEYIRDNYPGDFQALTNRMGNGRYDGPDNWLDRIDNKMQIAGAVPDVQSMAPTMYPPANDWWDPHSWYGGDWTAWWTGVFGSTAPQTFGSPYNADNWWPGDIIPNCVPFTTAAITPGVDAWYPPLNSSWGYDSPREFQDLPSAIYHIGNASEGRGQYISDPYPSGGDLRLGEITSPFGGSIYGHDLGTGNPNAGQTFGDGDGFIPAGGPLAYNGHAQYVFDGMNVLSLEVATWRTDGEALTGPQAPLVSRGNGTQVIGYGGDHRDVNLDGLIDQGETIPANSHSYFVDDDSATPDGGLMVAGCRYPFNWDRYVEDTIEGWDYAEDYARASRYSVDAVDELISDSGLGTPPIAGVPATNIVGAASVTPHTPSCREMAYGSTTP